MENVLPPDIYCMGIEFFGGYIVSAAIFYALLAKTAPFMNEEEPTMPRRESEDNVVHLFTNSEETQQQKVA